ncbi:MAG: hypothetical protein SGI72_00495 [Planctomycetota bacterium]|nr:hypothetical protein [Planctomycetota bacterium]
MQCNFVQSKFIAALALAAFAPSLAFADTIGAGYAHDASRQLSAGTTFAAYDTLSNGNRLVYNGDTAWIESDAGIILQVLSAVAPQGTFPSFIEADPTETFAVLGESTSGGVFRINLASGTLTPLATINFNFDIAYESSTSVLISAAASPSFASTNVERLDLVTGMHTIIVAVSGPSGPIALSPAGDLYYATQTLAFPTPPGFVSVIRWTNGQLANGPFPLTQARSSLFAANFDGAGSMTFDPAFGNLFVSVGLYSGNSTIVEIDRTGARVGVVATSPDTMGKVEIVDVPGDGDCAAFQPAGRALKYRRTDFFSTNISRIETVSPRRPQLTSVQNPNNTMTCTLSGGHPNAFGYVLSGNVSQYTSPESSFDLVKQLFWTGMPLNGIRRAGITFATDANGEGSFTFSNPPSSHGLFVIQALVTDPNGVYRGASTAAFN